jgi:hypothetical protein
MTSQTSGHRTERSAVFFFSNDCAVIYCRLYRSASLRCAVCFVANAGEEQKESLPESTTDAALLGVHAYPARLSKTEHAERRGQRMLSNIV